MGLEAKEDVDGFVLTSACKSVFSAGLDLTQVTNRSEAELREFWTAFESMWVALYSTPLATVAAINGACPALGAVLALSCDHRILLDQEKNRIGLNETALSMTPPKWLGLMCERTLGPREAERALQRALLFSPQDALEVGYVDALAGTEEELAELSMKAMTEMMKVGQEARAECKLNQRKAALELAGQASVDYMIPRLMGDSFQST